MIQWPFALTGHMVQNPISKEFGRFEHKGIPICQVLLSFVLHVPLEDATLFCHPVWRIFTTLPVSAKGSLSTFNEMSRT